MRRNRHVLGIFLLAAMALAWPLSVSARPVVTVLEGKPWVPGDRVRAGAAEMEVLLCAARLRQSQQPAGIVSVGNRQGNLQPATELALDRAAFMGVAVVRVARDGMAPAQPSRLFVAAGTLSAIAARSLLQDCLARFGAPPAAVNPLQPTAKERTAISVQLARFQQAFDAVQPAILVAVR